MVKKDYLAPFIISGIISIILLVIIIIQATGMGVIGEELETCETCPEENAMMIGIMNSWGENMYDSSENIFDVSVANYGYSEAKNVEVTCKVYDSDIDGNIISEIPIGTVTKKIGNVASVSYKYVELYLEQNSRMDDFSTALCSVTRCDNCEILEDRIL